jgi:dihydroorotate dehydrogenase electron transfer subunit
MGSPHAASRTKAIVRSNTLVGDRLWSLVLSAPAIASAARPGQFVNIRVANSPIPLLRRPFSIATVDRDTIGLLIGVVGAGTQILADNREGDELDLIGPLGSHFTIDGSFETPLLVGGGVGVAPFPFLVNELQRCGKRAIAFVGARSANGLVLAGLNDVHVATDDGTRGRRGTVIELLQSFLAEHPLTGTKIFGCGPTPMLKALKVFTQERRIPCELSLEGAMACGIGICQGCPVRNAFGERKYSLVCKDGPVFDAETVALE